MTRTCSRCGKQAELAEGDDAGVPLGWSFGVDPDGRMTFICAECARANIRAIEGKLPEEYWEF